MNMLTELLHWSKMSKYFFQMHFFQEVKQCLSRLPRMILHLVTDTHNASFCFSFWNGDKLYDRCSPIQLNQDTKAIFLATWEQFCPSFTFQQSNSLKSWLKHFTAQRVYSWSIFFLPGSRTCLSINNSGGNNLSLLSVCQSRTVLKTINF